LKRTAIIIMHEKQIYASIVVTPTHMGGGGGASLALAAPYTGYVMHYMANFIFITVPL